MDQAKSFDTLLLASITSGTALTSDYSDLHEAVEHILGYLIWHHEYPASRHLAAEFVLARYPGFPAVPIADLSGVEEELYRCHGLKLMMPRGGLQRTASPLDTLRDIYVAKGIRLSRCASPNRR